MALKPDDFVPLIERNGPVQVVDEAGAGITHAPSGMFQAITPPLAQVRSQSDVKLVLFDEQTRPTREIPGSNILKIEPSQPGRDGRRRRHDRSRHRAEHPHARLTGRAIGRAFVA